MVNFEFGKQSDCIDLVQGSDYFGEVGIVFQEIGCATPALQEVMFAIFEIGQNGCGDTPKGIQSVEFEQSNVEPLVIKPEIFCSMTKCLDAGVRSHIYQISGMTCEGAVVRICWGFANVIKGFL